MSDKPNIPTTDSEQPPYCLNSSKPEFWAVGRRRLIRWILFSLILLNGVLMLAIVISDLVTIGVPQGNPVFTVLTLINLLLLFALVGWIYSIRNEELRKKRMLEEAAADLEDKP